MAAAPAIPVPFRIRRRVESVPRERLVSFIYPPVAHINSWETILWRQLCRKASLTEPWRATFAIYNLPIRVVARVATGRVGEGHTIVLE